jgi:predicted amidohydrolase
VDRFAELARQYHGWIVVGLPEVDGVHDGYYNTAALIGPDGSAGKYRKSHSYITEVRWARDGDLGFPVFDAPLGRLGILICMDAEYPESARVLALAGCDVVCFPTNWLDEKSPSAYWLQRAWENGTYWVCANRLGLERGVQFSGGSAILGPDGEVLAALDDTDGAVMAEIDPGRSTATRQRRLAARRQGLYQAMALNSYLWPGDHVADRGDSDALEGVGPVLSPATVRMAVEDGIPAADNTAAQVEDRLARWPADLAAPAPTMLPATGVRLASGMREQDPLHWFLPRIRAAENNAWLVFANAGSLTSGIFGPSFYRSPRRESLAADGPVRMELAADRTDLDRRIALEKPYLRMRPLHLYSTLSR